MYRSPIEASTSPTGSLGLSASLRLGSIPKEAPMKSSFFALIVIVLGLITCGGAVRADEAEPLQLDENVSTRVEDLRLDEIRTTPDPQEELQLPELLDTLNYQGLMFDSVTIQINDPDRLPQEQTSQFNLRMAIEEPQRQE